MGFMAGIKRLFIPGALLLCLMFCGCLTIIDNWRASSQRPGWIAYPKTDDSLYVYRTGHSAGSPTKEAARDAAFQDSILQVARIFLPLTGEEGVINLLSVLSLKNVEILPDCFYAEKRGGLFEGWVQVSFPIVEKQKIYAQIEAGDKLEQMWQAILMDAKQAKYDTARKQLTELFANKNEALLVNVDLDEARLLQGDIFKEQKDVIEARRSYDIVRNTSTSEKWKKLAEEKTAQLPEPPRFWQMADRWGGKGVGLVCAIRDGAKCRWFKDLTAILTGDCGEAKIANCDIGQKMDAGQLSEFFDKMDFVSACSAAEGQGAGIVFGVLYDIDPAKRGVMISQFDMTVPVPDTVVKFFVVRTPDNKLMYNDQFREITGEKAESALAGRAASVIITKYLVPNSPSVPEPPPVQ